jgi:hypothetical protein
LGEDLPRVWHAATTTAAERKRILRFIVHEYFAHSALRFGPFRHV